MARGGKRPGAGRPKGRRNTATVAQKGTLEELARAHTLTALDALVGIAMQGDSESARVSACTAILDRGYGKPKQVQELTGKDGAAAPFAVSVTIGSESSSSPETG